jgi:hypothetical protein
VLYPSARKLVDRQAVIVKPGERISDVRIHATKTRAFVVRADFSGRIATPKA